jgi:glycosyltransferase involved in cell wall biosynthesis
MKRMGQQSNVLNIDPRAPQSDAYIKVSGAVDLGRELIRHAADEWVFQVHTNGHNAKSWMIALACGIASQFGPGSTLTLHSGIAPQYMRTASRSMRRLIRFACVLHRQVICVNDEIASAVAELGIAMDQIRVAPAFLPVSAPDVVVPMEIEAWLARHSPVLSSVMFFRPEYGFELLVEAISQLRTRYPGIGGIVVGGDREEARGLVERRGLAETVFLAGDLDHELCLAVMSRSDVFVRPTLRDGDSISVREALALGVPVVASGVGTRPEGARLFEAGDVDGFVGIVAERLSEAFPSSWAKEGWTRR